VPSLCPRSKTPASTSSSARRTPLWKQGAARHGELIGPVADVVPREDMPALGTDEADAVLCALTAACHDNQVRELGRELPRLWLPEDEFPTADREPDGARLVRQEGWIYCPAPAKR
jgi:hypothetical protein